MYVKGGGRLTFAAMRQTAGFAVCVHTFWCYGAEKLNRNVLNTLSICKAGEGRGIVPPLTNGNMADDRIGDAETMISGRMEHWGVCESCFW